MSELKDSILIQKDNQIQELQNKLENLALKAMNKSSRVQDTERSKKIKTLIPITDEHINDMCQQFGLEYIQRGMEGYVFFAFEAVFKDRIYCSDFSRRKFIYKNSEGDVISDKGMVKLARKFFKAVEKINTKILDHQISMLQTEHDYFQDNPESNEMEGEILDEYLNELAKMEKQIDDYKILLHGVKKIATGHFPDFLAKFVREICNKLS